eukprot:COSAG01_NODE_50175_length_365_cov_1.394737_1_plen_42_part_10
MPPPSCWGTSLLWALLLFSSLLFSLLCDGLQLRPLRLSNAGL